MSIYLKTVSLVEKLVGASAIIVSSYYILHGLTAFSSLYLVPHIQGGTFSKITFILDTIINNYLLPLSILVSGLLYVNSKIDRLAILFTIIIFLLLTIVIIIQHGNIKPYLLMIIINSILLIMYIVHKNVKPKKEESASCT